MKYKNTFLSYFIILIISCLFCCTKSNNINKIINNSKFVGSILIAINKKVIFEKGFGFSDYEKKIQNTPETVYRIASITKQFTAMGIMMLQEKGMLNVNDKINKYIPDYPNGEKITIKNLLTHTSGIAEHTIPSNFSKFTYHYSPEDIIKLFKYKSLSFKPGSMCIYCNSNYILLGYIIEKITKLKFEDYIKKNIFIPLNMNNSGYDHNETADNKAVGYLRIIDNSILYKAKFMDMSVAYSTGALQSTVKDLFIWDQALYTEKLVSKKTLKEIFTPHIGGYGYGWIIQKQGDNPVMVHRGLVYGFRSYIYRNTEKKITIIILCNNQSFDIENLFNNILKILK